MTAPAVLPVRRGREVEEFKLICRAGVVVSISVKSVIGGVAVCTCGCRSLLQIEWRPKV